MKKKLRRLFTFQGVIQAFVAVGAIPAAILMIIDPSGKLMGLPSDMLAESPFKDFLVPGIFLLVLNGLFQAAGAALSFKKQAFAPHAGFILGLILTSWILVQGFFLGLGHFFQFLYLGIGLFEAILAIFLYKALQDSASS